MRPRLQSGGSARPLNFTLEVAMEQSGSAPWSSARVRRLRFYRLLANLFIPLIGILFVTVALRWTLPQLLRVWVVIWSAVTLLVLLIALPWVLVSFGFALGGIKCPSCNASFAPGFRAWVPKICRSCGYNIGAPLAATSNNRWRGP